MQKINIYLIAGLLLIAGLFYGFQRFQSTGSDLDVRISKNNTVIATYALDEDRTETFAFDDGYNTVKIENGQVDVIDADCSNQICVDTPPIDEPGEVIACLPHQFIVEIIQNED